MSFLDHHFKDKKVLITGHTGFKGSWLSAWLLELGANIVGVSLSPSTSPSHFSLAGISNNIEDIRSDIRDIEALKKIFLRVQPDFVFHLAAQAIVRKSYDDPLETWHTNLIGTINVLESLRLLDKPCATVLITSDKCYENVEWLWGYREIDRLGGIDPYSASKAAAELAIKSYINSYFPIKSNKVRIGSARAGNVIGGGDWSSDRIIPDCVRAWLLNYNLELRNPNSTRPWQHVLEPLSGYLIQAIKLSNKEYLHGESFNFGPTLQSNQSVLDLVKEICKHWDKLNWNDTSKTIDNLYESNLLMLNCDKAYHRLNWHPVLNFEQTVKMTAEWYKSFYKDNSILTHSQIKEYCFLANKKGLEWAL